MPKQRVSARRRERPVIVGVGGSRSGIGKTSVATRILSAFAGWGAIKYTNTSLYSSIIDDESILAEEGKDTRRLLDAGAAKVLWVRAPREDLGELLHVAIEMMSHLDGVVIEGNSAIEVSKPDIVIFVAGEGKSMKESAKKVLTMADIVVASTDDFSEAPRGAVIIRERDGETLIATLSELIDRFRGQDADRARERRGLS